jgi:UDP-galactopyranose mutase
MTKKILVVGAGFSGATVARTLAEAGHDVLVIDRRNHIAGNAFDYQTGDGTRIHKYGPHLWHTSNQKVQTWASRFTTWLEHRHWVEALLPNGTRSPLPVNYQTVEDVFAKELIAAYGANYVPEIHIPEFLETLKVEHPTIENGRQLMESKIGKVLTELFFARYTEKMWGLTLDQLPESIAARVGAREDMLPAPLNGYFKDTWQKVPENGYTNMVENILNHPNITLRLLTDRRNLPQFCNGGYITPYLGPAFNAETKFDAVFTSEPLDEMYDCDLGPLKWRSIRMHVENVRMPKISNASVTNFTHTGPYTRMTEWKNIPGHAGRDPHTTWVTTEEPCDYTENNMERYYPVKTVGDVDENRELWKKYRDRAEAEGYILIGRCANYAYLDMHQAISSALAAAEGWLESQG